VEGYVVGGLTFVAGAALIWRLEQAPPSASREARNA
jgi:hypothetical protein